MVVNELTRDQLLEKIGKYLVGGSKISAPKLSKITSSPTITRSG